MTTKKVKKLTLPSPNEKQKLFFASRKRYIGYGGARGGGKSWAMRVKFLLMALKYPGLKLLLLRKTLPELRANHIIPLQILLANTGLARFNKDERAFIFRNGSRLTMGYCAKDNDVFQYQGHEYDIIGVEECTHFYWDWITFLKTCNRNVRKDIKPRMYFTGNPGGVGHRWFKRLFVKGEYEKNENPDDYEFIPATLYDNTVLMKYNPEYEQTLKELPDQLREAHLYGNWDLFEGQFFEEFRDIRANYLDRTWTHVIEPFEVPDSWKIFRTFDWGYSKPFACQWWAMDHDGRLYNILELYGCSDRPDTGVKWEPNKVFAEIARIEREHRWLKGKFINGVADPAIWDAQKGESIADIAEKHQVYFEKGDNKRIPGWMQIHYRLAFDDEGIPMMYIFNTCRGMVRTFPELQYSSTLPEDLDTKGEDHLADATRYLMMMNPIPPRKTTYFEKLALNPLSDEKKYDKYAFYRT